jgi:hypothetical protein
LLPGLVQYLVTALLQTLPARGMMDRSGRGGPCRDAKTLDTLCAEELSYSHAHIEDKAMFIKNATSDNSTFQSLEYKTLGSG